MGGYSAQPPLHRAVPVGRDCCSQASWAPGVGIGEAQRALAVLTREVWGGWLGTGALAALEPHLAGPLGVKSRKFLEKPL